MRGATTVLATAAGRGPARTRRRTQSPAGREGCGRLEVATDFVRRNQRPEMAGAPNQSLIAARPCFKLQLSRAKRDPHGAGPRAIGSLYFWQTLTAFLQFTGEHYPATGQDQVIFFETVDRMSTRDWKAVSAALDRNQPTTTFLGGNLTHGAKPLTDRSSGVGPIHGVEP